MGATPLGLFVHHGNHELVRKLIESGANIRSAIGGLSLLSNAISRKDAPTVKLLLEGGVDPTVGPHPSLLPLAVAEKLRATEIVGLLKARLAQNPPKPPKRN